MRKYNIHEKAAGEMAICRMSEKAQKAYSKTDPLTIYEYGGGMKKYAYDGVFGQDYDLTFGELESWLEELADE